jgi:hypothetical protein
MEAQIWRRCACAGPDSGIESSVMKVTGMVVLIRGSIWFISERRKNLVRIEGKARFVNLGPFFHPHLSRLRWSRKLTKRGWDWRPRDIELPASSNLNNIAVIICVESLAKWLVHMAENPMPDKSELDFWNMGACQCTLRWLANAEIHLVLTIAL